MRCKGAPSRYPARMPPDVIVRHAHVRLASPGVQVYFPVFVEGANLSMGTCRHACALP